MGLFVVWYFVEFSFYVVAGEEVEKYQTQQFTLVKAGFAWLSFTHTLLFVKKD